ncbi:MAG: MATE family efflux transporter, partial [Bacteroidales bacterium]|nr:MATE family efflux transporter [Bacteroidales bacterium]
MVIITSIYGVVDGVMVSNYVGTTSFAALNLIWPFIAILGSLGLMIGTGGSALVAKNLGEGNNERACNLFSMLTVTAIVVGVVMGVLGFLVVEDVAKLLGAEGEMLAGSVTYGSILLLTLPLYVMQVYFQSLLITAERPKLGMWITIGAGLLHILLDVIFV